MNMSVYGRDFACPLQCHCNLIPSGVGYRGGIGAELGDRGQVLEKGKMQQFGFRQFVSDVDVVLYETGGGISCQGSTKYYINNLF